MRTLACPQCQADNPADALVCENCGSSLLGHGVIEDKQWEPDDSVTSETEQLLDWLKDLEPSGEQPDRGSLKSVESPEAKLNQTRWLIGWLRFHLKVMTGKKPRVNRRLLTGLMNQKIFLKKRIHQRWKIRRHSAIITRLKVSPTNLHPKLCQIG